MLAFLEKILQMFRPIIRTLVKVGILLGIIGMSVLFIEVKVLPWLSTQAWATRLGITSQLNERMTVIERKETVTISQDENIERFGTEYSTSTVGVLETTILPLNHSSFVALEQSRFLSGVFVTNDGVVVTYRDQAPLANQYQYTVYSADNSAHEATLLGYDTLTQLLYLKVNNVTTSAASFTYSNEVKVGRRIILFSRTSTDLSVAINSIGEIRRSFHLSPQTVASSEKWEGVFGLGMRQLDNQPLGSPAFFMNGELAGIFGTKKIDGVTDSFLIPASALRESLNRILEGKGERPVVGIYYLTLTPALQKIFGVSVDHGAMVYSPSERTGLSLIAGSPAARAGLQFGDIITKVNDAEINLDLPLSVALGRVQVPGPVVLEIVRNGVKQEVLITL